MYVDTQQESLLLGLEFVFVYVFACVNRCLCTVLQNMAKFVVIVHMALGLVNIQKIYTTIDIWHGYKVVTVCVYVCTYYYAIGK